MVVNICTLMANQFKINGSVSEVLMEVTIHKNTSF